MSVDLAVIGAGPFGLAVAADARRHGIGVRWFGEPMGFWRRNMPSGMILRSASDWHLDVAGALTVERFLAERGLRPQDVEPLPLELYLEYAQWFADRAGVQAEPAQVTGLRLLDDGSFDLDLNGERRVTATAVVVAVGLRTFAQVPAELVAQLPPGRWTHTSDIADPAVLGGRRCLVVGGRQSAYEYSALLLEAGARSVDLTCRHPAPAFAAAEWDWASALADGLTRDPGSWRRLSDEARQRVHDRLWAEGRLKVEPWLEPRLRTRAFTVHAHRRVRRIEQQPDESLRCELDDDSVVVADHIVFATGYQPDVTTVRLLDDLLPKLALSGRFPALDDGFGTSVPGLFVAGALAAADFGPLFGFTVVARPAAAVLGAAVRRYLAGVASNPGVQAEREVDHESRRVVAVPGEVPAR